jgi:hypothetical protein
MDAVILASNGAYSDRSDFIAEALRDRIEAEEEQFRDPAVPAPRAVAATAESEAAATETEITIFADWAEEDPPVLPRAAGPETNFGLHNRDWPTLWSADWLGRLTAGAASPISFSAYLDELVPRAWQQGRLLAARDLDRPPGAKLAAGFPTNVRKREGAEARFRAHAVGVASERGHQGPLFVFGLVGVTGEDEDPLVALSPEGLTLLARLARAGVGDGPPFNQDAWKIFCEHLAQYASKELETWMTVLSIVAEGPDRAALVTRCHWWSGSTADTNAMSYVARGREWGLVETGLTDGHYRLTELGQTQIKNQP